MANTNTISEARIVEIQRLVDSLTKFVNSYTPETEKFVEIMACEHRTLQQSFTKLCLLWIEHTASQEYRTDGRNEASQKISQTLIGLFRGQSEGNTPAAYLPMI